MIVIGVAAAAASIMGLKCPHCKRIQARARQEQRFPIVCRFCEEKFSRAEGEALYRKRRH